MKCDDVVSYFDLYLSVPLEKGSLLKDFEQHIHECPDCAQNLKIYQACFSLKCDIEKDFSFPHDLDAKIKFKLQEARETKSKKSIKKFSIKRATAFVTAASFLVIIAVFGNNFLNDYKKIRDNTENIPETIAITDNTEQHKYSAVDNSSAETADEKKSAQYAGESNKNEKNSGREIENNALKNPTAAEVHAALPPAENPAALQEFSADINPTADGGHTLDSAAKSEDTEASPKETPAPKAKISPAAAPIPEAADSTVNNGSNVENGVTTQNEDVPARNGRIGVSVSSGGGAGGATALIIPQTDYNATIPEKYKTAVLAKYIHEDLGGGIYIIHTDINTLQSDFEEVIIISSASSDTITVKFI